MTRCHRRMFAFGLGILLISQPLRSQHPACQKFQSLPGNDDIVVMVDTSLSTIPIIDEIRKQLKTFFDCYVKEGDFVIVASFDATCQIEIATRILDRGRDLPILLRQVDSLTPRREICWTVLGAGEFHESLCSQARRREGGGQKTDLGAMMEELEHLLTHAHTPENRRFVAIYTDGVHDPPSWSPHRNIPSLREIFEEREVNFSELIAGGTHLGLIATNDQATRILEEVAERMDPDRSLRDSNKFGVQRKAGESLAANFSKLWSRVYLYPDADKAVRKVELGRMWHPAFEREVLLENGTPSEQKVIVSQIRAELRGPQGRPHDLVVAPGPFEWVLGSEEELRVPIRAELPVRPLGSYTGRLVFDISSGTQLSPASIDLRYESVGFFDAHPRLWAGSWLLFSLMLLTLGIIGARWYVHEAQPKPIYVECNYRSPQGESISAESPQTLIACGQTLEVGGMNSGAELGLRELPINQVFLSIARRRLHRYLAISSSGKTVAARIGIPVHLTNSLGQGWELSEDETGGVLSPGGRPSLSVVLYEGSGEELSLPDFKSPQEV